MVKHLCVRGIVCLRKAITDFSFACVRVFSGSSRLLDCL